MTIFKKILYGILPVLAILTILLGWILISMPAQSQFPSLAETGEKFIFIMKNEISGGTLPIHILMSLQRVIIAVAIATVSGVILGVSVGWSKTFRAIFMPIFEVFRPIPPIAWLPIIILSLGIGELPKIAIVYISAFMPVIMNTITGMDIIDPLLYDAGKVLGATNHQMFFNIAIPACTPAIIAGVKTSMSAGWMTVLAAEMIVSKQGVGFLIITGMQNGDMPLIVVSMFAIGIVSALITICLTKIEEVLTQWNRA